MTLYGKLLMIFMCIMGTGIWKKCMKTLWRIAYAKPALQSSNNFRLLFTMKMEQ